MPVIFRHAKNTLPPDSRQRACTAVGLPGPVGTARNRRDVPGKRGQRPKAQNRQPAGGADRYAAFPFTCTPAHFSSRISVAA